MLRAPTDTSFISILILLGLEEMVAKERGPVMLTITFKIGDYQLLTTIRLIRKRYLVENV